MNSGYTDCIPKQCAKSPAPIDTRDRERAGQSRRWGERGFWMVVVDYLGNMSSGHLSLSSPSLSVNYE